MSRLANTWLSVSPRVEWAVSMAGAAEPLGLAKREAKYSYDSTHAEELLSYGRVAGYK